MPRRNAVDDPGFDRLARQILGHPVRHRQAKILRLLAGKSDDLRQLLRRKLRRASAAFVVGQDITDHGLQVVFGRIAPAGLSKLRRRGGPSLAPSPGTLSVDAHATALFSTGQSFTRPQDETDTLGEPHRQLPRPRQTLQDHSFAIGKNNGRRAS